VTWASTDRGGAHGKAKMVMGGAGRSVETFLDAAPCQGRAGQRLDICLRRTSFHRPSSISRLGRASPASDGARLEKLAAVGDCRLMTTLGRGRWPGYMALATPCAGAWGILSMRLHERNRARCRSCGHVDTSLESAPSTIRNSGRPADPSSVSDRTTSENACATILATKKGGMSGAADQFEGLWKVTPAPAFPLKPLHTRGRARFPYDGDRLWHWSWIRRASMGLVLEAPGFSAAFPVSARAEPHGRLRWLFGNR